MTTRGTARVARIFAYSSVGKNDTITMPTVLRQRLHRTALVCLVYWLLSACAGTSLVAPLVTGAADPQTIELVDTPFFPQRRYQCGPAALATALKASGVAVDADALTEWIYLPERKGSLQLELIATARRFERVPYVLPESLAPLLAEIRAGRPVVVLQNLGLRRRPYWHYAVVVGFDAARDRLVLRSGTTRRKIVRASRFMRTWRRADSWALVMLRPSELPADPDHDRYVRAVAGLEATGHIDTATTAYRTALGHWPQSRFARLGLGNAYYLGGDLIGAAEQFKTIVENSPSAVVPRNNLAQVMAELHCTDAALEQIELALGAPDSNSELFQMLNKTRDSILARQANVELHDCPM